MTKLKTLDAFFKRKNVDISESNLPTNQVNLNTEVPPFKSSRLESKDHPSHFEKLVVEEFDINSRERDPRLRTQIWEYPVNKRDEIRRAYLKDGPYQIQLSEYPFSIEKYPRRFQYSWFTQFSWLEYSLTQDAVYCLSCYLFNSKDGVRNGTYAFTVKGFHN